MNQCDGCKLNLPIENGIHVHPGEKGWNRLHMACTKDKYEEEETGTVAQPGSSTSLKNSVSAVQIRPVPLWKLQEQGDVKH